MFDFFEMAGTYDSRKVDRYEEGDLLISTAAITDSQQPYETAVSHPKYNDNKFIVVEMYDNKSQAIKGHKRWVKIMTAESLPSTLMDVSTSSVKLLGNDLFGDDDDWITDFARED